ncbi:hypothetical protein N0V83_004948 [Neocucurbitaria cava]|uniref:Uncharacterized protein n=1 Tax=Neocucurbitaria cava TaxID=798079 RepID=A0A9W8Y8P4_9PLEO|nr:hypothetical protein N0V83_004948 [Neocucurbitaria cava]
MTILLEDKPARSDIFAPTAKSRLLKTLVRHVSAPASSLPSPAGFDPSEGNLSISQKRSRPPLRPFSSSTPRSEQGLLSELSLAQSYTYNWHVHSQKHITDNILAEDTVKSRARTISEQQGQIIDLHHSNEGDPLRYKQLYTRFQAQVTKHNKLVDQLNDALRTINRLKKSDRAKGKVQQRNLRLKATLQHYTSRDGSSTSHLNGNVENTVLEALALANERIEQLESKGESLLDLLEEGKDGGQRDAGGDISERNVSEEILVAKVAFREILEDETFREQKVNWAELLDE